MTAEAAIYLLKNAAWIGTVKECMELEKAIETLENMCKDEQGKEVSERDQ